ncbi:NUDIX hydrolase [Cyanobium sp. NIES-981]|uniref:NUDIX hydrolase n=1 Tax=Cyanobium sp. NIES-981 TaxID=1851505 RepID=UPI0007DD755A|nr:NUDIX hydrolase [Cyanobium sp. NIES-981]SBO41857.1 Nudix family protein [Cyanobium sp. NIES-981]
MPAPPVEVALAVLEQRGHWLVQLRDDVPGIVAPGAWGLFGGHLDAGESAQQAVRRELLEEIHWWPPRPLPFWFRHTNAQRIAHVFRATLPLPLEALVLQEGQDMVLASLAELVSGSIWSPRLQQHRPLAASLCCALQAHHQALPSGSHAAQKLDPGS